MTAKRRGLIAVVLLAFLMAAAWLIVASRAQSSLIVYCTHDLIFAQKLIDEFSLQSGIAVEVVGDTETAKSLGLVQRVERERGNPGCDVFWNNEPLGTLSLATKNLLEPYSSPEEARRPDSFQDPRHEWTGFGVRYRVWIINTEKMPATVEAIDARMNAADLSRVAIAEPLYGTTLTHWSLLWDRLGPEELKKWHTSLKSRGCHFVKGNGAVRDLVAAGTCDFGMTDTDDFFGAKDAKAPVAMLPILVRQQTIAIPNTVSLVRGLRHPEPARRFVDFLLSASSDVALAKSGSRQAPVHTGIAVNDLPPEVVEMHAWAKDAADLSGLLKSRNACLDWLLTEFAP